MSTESPRIILGAGNVGDSERDSAAKYDKPEEVAAFLSVYHNWGGRHIDTARNYSPHAHGSSEPRLGAVGAGDRFSIDTKIGGRHHSAELIQASCEGSVADLKLPAGSKIDVMFLHAPDRETPFEETCQALDKAFREGYFKRFGLSNFRADEVEKIVAICTEKGYNPPTVYQGQYNPIVRRNEAELFPVLRKHGIAFYAWSPSAGGAFAGGHRLKRKGGRFDPSLRLGAIYTGWYSQSDVEAAIDQAVAAAVEHGLSGHAAALRWTVYHSLVDYDKGDAVIIGASSCAQLASNLDIIDAGPLPQPMVDVMERVFEQLSTEISYHF